MKPDYISRKAAKEAGATKYFNGKPCKNGHISERYVVGCRCVECSSEAYSINKEKRYNIDYWKECFSYNSEDGLLYWKERPRHHFKEEYAFRAFNRDKAGKVAGLFSKRGCGGVKVYVIPICHGPVLGHHIIWALNYGYNPTETGLFVDHIDGNPTNNRIENLRLVDATGNSRNRGIQSNSTSGHLGVDFSKHKNKWRARIKVDGKEEFIGYFENLEDAISARKNAERDHGFHPNHSNCRRGD